MGKINRDDYQNRSDVLSADDIEEAAMLTITEFQDGDRKDDKGKWALLKFEETDKVMFLNESAIDALVEHYGDDTDNWIGEKLPVEQYDTKNGKRVRVMAAEEWEGAFKQNKMKLNKKAAAPATSGKRK